MIRLQNYPVKIFVNNNNNNNSTLDDKIIFKFVFGRFCRGFCIVSTSGCLQWVESIPRYILSPFSLSQNSIFINMIHKRGRSVNIQ